MSPSAKAVFENRDDAGRQLAEKLAEYAGQSAVVLAIPNGGVPVALGIALALEAELDLVISRKLPLPLLPEGGFGAVTDGGTIILDEAMVKQAGLNQSQIDHQVGQVRAGILKRSLLYQREKRPVSVTGRTVIIVDDGLAAGYTMKAAVVSVRHRRPGQVIVAVPVGPEPVIKEMAAVADRVITCAVGDTASFFVADYYRYWRDVSDDEVLRCLREYQVQHSRQGAKRPPEIRRKPF
jgi:predicted phosphoribosyltransferase